MARISLTDLVNQLDQRFLVDPAESSLSPTRVEISSLSFDPLPIEPGSLYVNLYGNHPRAIMQMASAVEKGAVAVGSEMEISLDLGVPYLRLPHPRLALSAAAAALHGWPSDSLTNIGITGSNGKTTTACMLARILQAAGRPNGLISSAAVKVAEKVTVPSYFTTPDAPEVHRCLSEMVSAGVRCSVIEVSSHALLHERVADVQFHSAIMTNLTRDHTDLHPTCEHYAQTKARLFRMLPCEGFAIYWADDQQAAAVASQTRARLISVGRRRDCMVRLLKNRLYVGRLAADLLERPTAEIQLRLSVHGAHNVLNGALAAVAAYAFGVAIEHIEQALETYPGVARRLQTIYEGAFRVVDDIGCSPGHYNAVFEWLAKQEYRRLIVVTNVRGARGQEINRTCASLLAKNLPAFRLRALLISNCSEMNHGWTAVTPEERTAFAEGLRTGPVQPKWMTTNLEALKGAVLAAGKDDLILLLGNWGLEGAGRLILSMLQARQKRFWQKSRPAKFYNVDPLHLARTALFPDGDA
jgi:UDP-N-acetylmuramoyl-L-alanyl-D-glutamate--2,6-diaminopimelate ligase